MSAAYAAYVIGWPLGHTLSPVMHQAALDELGLDATYTALPTPPGAETDRFDDVRSGALAGLNVTIPHKLAAFRAMDRLTPAAERTGAVNTVIRDGPRLLGDNTDPYGFIQALRQFGGFDPAGASVVVLGAGGAARAAVLALLDSGASQILVANRTPARAHELVNDLQASDNTPIHACALTDPRLPRALAAAQLLVNTTSVGMSGGPAPAASPVSADSLHSNLFVYDIVIPPRRHPPAGRCPARAAPPPSAASKCSSCRAPPASSNGPAAPPPHVPCSQPPAPRSKTATHRDQSRVSSPPSSPSPTGKGLEPAPDSIRGQWVFHPKPASHGPPQGHCLPLTGPASSSLSLEGEGWGEGGCQPDHPPGVSATPPGKLAS